MLFMTPGNLGDLPVHKEVFQHGAQSFTEQSKYSALQGKCGAAGLVVELALLRTAIFPLAKCRVRRESTPSSKVPILFFPRLR